MNPNRGSDLPARHIETLRLICEGHTNAEIGVLMFVGEETIKSRVKVLLRHFGARNRWHLAALAIASRTVEVRASAGSGINTIVYDKEAFHGSHVKL